MAGSEKRLPRIAGISGALKPTLILTGYLLLFVALDRITFVFETSPSISPWYPPPGLTLALLLTVGLAYAPATFLAVTISGLWIWRLDMPLPFLALLALFITAGYSLAAFLLRRVLRIDRRLRRLRSVSWFVVVSLLAPGAVAASSIATFLVAGVIPRSDYLSAVVDFWVGDAIGIITLTPFLLVHVFPWARAVVRGGKGNLTLDRRELPGIAAKAASILLALWLAFGPPAAGQINLFYLCFLPSLWIALQHGLRGATLGVLTISVGIVLFSSAFGFQFANLAEMQILLLSVALVSLFLGALVTERERMEKALRQSKKNAHALLDATTESAFLMAPDGTVLATNETTAHRLGAEMKEFIGSDAFGWLPPDLAKQRRTQVERVIQSGAPIRFEDERRGRIIDNNVHPIFDDRGNVTKLAVFGRDITEQRHAMADLRTSNRFLEIANRHTSMHPLLDEIVSEVKELTGCDAAGIRILDEESHAIPYEAYGYESVAMVPIRTQNRTLGLIHAADHREDAIPLRTVQQLERVAKHLGANLRRIEVEEALWRRNRELSLFNRVWRTLGSTLDMDIVLEALLEEVRGLLDIVACSVWLIDPETGELVCQQATGPQRDVVRGWRLSPGEGLAGWSAHHGESLIVADAPADDRHFGGVDRQTGLALRSILTVPVKTEEGVIGVLQAVDCRVDYFEASNLRLLEPVAASAAMAIENARLYAQAQQEIARRKRAERTLRESEKRFRLLYEDAPLGYQSLDTEGCLLDVNRAWLELFGYTEKESVIGRWFGAFIAPEQREAFTACFEDFKAAGEIHNVEFEAIRDDGSRMILSFDGNVAYDQRRGFKRTHCILSDITERRRLEEAYRTVVEHSLQGLAIMRGNRVDFANPAIAELTGYTIPRLLAFSSDDLQALIHPEDREQIWDALQQDLAGERTPGREEFRIIRKDGEIRWVETLANPVTHEGEPAVQIAYVDITERKRAERALQESERELQLTLDATTDAIWKWNFKKDELSFSPRYYTMLGYEPGEFPASFESWRDLIHPDDRDAALSVAQAYLAAKPDSYENEFRMRTKAGDYRWIHTTARVVERDDDGDAVRMIGSHKDITERKRAEEALRRRVEELNALQATVLDITARHDPSPLLETIVRRATQLLGASGGGLYLCDPEREEARCVVSYNTQRDYTGTVLSYGEGAAGVVAQTKEPLIVDDYRAWSERAAVYEEDQPFGAVLSAPTIWGGEVTGVIHVLHDVEAGGFTQSDLELLTLFANHAAIAVENARLYEELRTGRQRLQALSQRLVEAQELERRRIARELHDEIGQALTAVKINLQTTQSLLEAPEHQAHLTHSIDAVERTLQGVRDLSLDLRPSLLDDLGLVPALRWYVDRQAQQAGFSARFQADTLEERLRPELEIACFRIVQEALTNVIRHTQARHVNVEVHQGDDALEILVRDDGAGFDVQRALDDAVGGRSLGLLNMEERAGVVGGELQIRSAPGKGTEIRARFPCS